MSSYLTNLNTEQLAAVEHFTGACLVTAVPGSGKTSTLTARVLRLMDKGVEPRNILCVTFTNKASQEMQERVKHNNPLAKKVWISTFHRLCLKLLHSYGDRVGLKEGFSIWDTDDQKSAMGKVHRMWAATHDDDGKISSEEKMMLMGQINNLREAAQHIDLPELNAIDARLGMYLQEMQDANAVDFSGMLYYGWKILTDHKVIADKLSERFQYVLVDEAQDTNDVQFAIAKRIAAHGNLFVVGDFQQSIFSWRGARPENLLRFQQDFPGAAVITLPRNYRSHQEILEHAERLIRKNHNAADVSLISHKGPGGRVRLDRYESNREEIRDIVYKIQNLRAKHNYKWEDFAVIYRLNKLSQAVEMGFAQSNIPYLTRGGPSFFNRREIKATLAYLQLLVNPADSNAFKEAVCNPRRGIGEVLIGRIDNFAKDNKITVTQAAEQITTSTKDSKFRLEAFCELMNKYREEIRSGVPLADVADRIVTESGYKSQLLKDAEDDPANGGRLDNLETFIGGISEYESTTAKPTLDKYLQTVTLVQDGDNPNRKNSVNLLTMHSAKGLEFPCVFVIGCAEGVIPHYLSVDEGREEEERRLFYVAITRAKDHLNVSYHEQVPHKQTAYESSRYYNEMADYAEENEHE